MAEGAQTKEELMDYLRRMRLGIDRLEKLVEGFIFLNNLQVSNAKTEYNQNHKAFTDWHGLTEKVVEKYRPWAERQKITLNKTVHYDKLGVVIVHVDYLFDAISRLVDNAIKFTPAEGNIGVDVWSRDGGVEILVRDTGIGISENRLEILARPLMQIDRDKREQQGAGVGLSVVKGIVELHGGKLEMESREGFGSIFSIWLPTILLKAEL